MLFNCRSFGFLFSAFAAAGCVLLAAAARAAPPSAEDFASQPAIQSVVMSPSGRRMAILMPAADGRVRLGVMDLDPIGPPRVVAAFSAKRLKKAKPPRRTE